jgi:hypothetical protein
MKVKTIILTIDNKKRILTLNSDKNIKVRANSFITFNKEKIKEKGINIKVVYDEKGDDGTVMENEGIYDELRLAKQALFGFLDV